MTQPRGLAALFTLLLMGASCLTCDPPPGPPDTEVCSDPAASAEIASIELVDASRDGALLRSDSGWALQGGAQGAEMSGLQIRLRAAPGAEVPGCVRQSTRVLRATGESVWTVEDNLRMSAGAAGEATSTGLWLVEPPREALRIEVEAYGQLLILERVTPGGPFSDPDGGP